MRDSLTEISPAPPSLCPNSWFACGDGECIEESKVCDFTPDCLHGDDEAGCRKTNV